MVWQSGTRLVWDGRGWMKQRCDDERQGCGEGGLAAADFCRLV